MTTKVSFCKFVVPEMIFGNGSFALVDGYAQRFGLNRVLVVSDPGVAAAGWTDGIVGCLDKAGISSLQFLGVTPNPKESEVMAGAEFYRQGECDGIIVVGGGSPIDCAKGIGIVCTNGGHILDFEGVDQVKIPIPPIICIPTTAGTAADISQFAIITSTKETRKIAIISKALVPDLALIDPLATTTMDKELTACTGMDALVHAVEAYLSTASSAFTDLQALEAIRLVAANLPAVMRNPNNMQAREGMMLASTMAGMAFSNASLGAVHAMAHSLGGILDSAHGDCNALLLEHVVAYNFSAAPERCLNIAQALGIELHGLAGPEAGNRLVGAIRSLRLECGITGTLTDRGVTSDIIPLLAGNAMQDACMVTNPRKPTKADIEGIYASAL